MEESKLDAEGNWWLPVSEYYQLPGTLSLNNTEGASLTIRGHFPVPIEIHSLRSKHDFIILGELNDGRKVTLIAYHILDQSENVSNNNFFSTIVFSIKFIIIGQNFESTSDIIFDSILVQYDNLNKYFRFFDFERSSIPTEESNSRSLVIKPLEFEVDTLSLVKIIYRHNSKDEFAKVLGSKDGVYVKFECTNKKSLDDYLEVASTFRDFLNFISGGDIRTFSLWGIMQSNPNQISETIEVLWQSPLSKRMQNSRARSENIFHQIKNELNDIINLWFDFKNQFPIVYGFWFAVANNEASYLSNKFLMTVGAIEAYHKSAWKKQSKITKEKESFLTKVKPVIENAIRNNPDTKDKVEVVKKLMADWNKPTLAQRFIELCN